MADKPDERLSGSLSESVLTLLTFGGEKGQIAAGLVTSGLFEEPYDDIAAQAITYRARYGQGPGKEHVDDLFDHVLVPGNDRAPAFQRILVAMCRQSEHLNEDYVLSRVIEFVRRQTYKGVIFKAAQRIQQGGEEVADDVERMLGEALRFQADSLDLGVVLSDKSRALSFLDRGSAERNDMLQTGIKEFDKANLCPTRKELFVFIGPRGSGKSMFLTHLTREALLHHWRVLDISLEMSEELKLQRIFQCLFSVTKHPGTYSQTLLEFTEVGRLAGLGRERIKPVASLRSPEARRYLTDRMDEWGAELDGLRVKQFPTGALTVPKLIAYLDMLENTHAFVPDLLLVDQPLAMWKDPRDPRLSLGMTVEQLRGIAVARNMAVVMPHQGNREGEQSKIMQSYHIAEDISIIATADQVVTYSATAQEKLLGLARLFCGKSRDDRDKFTVLITQNYRAAQFIVQSAPMLGTYWDELKKHAGVVAAQEEEEEVE